MNQSDHVALSSSYDELRSIAKNAKRYVLLCQNGQCTDNSQKSTTQWSRNREMNWLIDMECTTCKNQWAICGVCANVKTAFTTDNQIKQHRYTYHNPNKPSKRTLIPRRSNKKPIAPVKTNAVYVSRVVII